MAGQTELRPVRGGCRHLRARYKVEQRGKSPFPDMELLRYECEQGQAVESDEDVQKCMETHLECWKKVR
ncbi:MAG TPA: hypothetical protein VMX94_09535 [Armatimonadota bacterium]|nr:hypothetical protein [Armatimonadota bacterium]